MKMNEVVCPQKTNSEWRSISVVAESRLKQREQYWVSFQKTSPVCSWLAMLHKLTKLMFLEPDTVRIADGTVDLLSDLEEFIR